LHKADQITMTGKEEQPTENMRQDGRVTLPKRVNNGQSGGVAPAVTFRGRYQQTGGGTSHLLIPVSQWGEREVAHLLIMGNDCPSVREERLPVSNRTRTGTGGEEGGGGNKKDGYGGFKGERGRTGGKSENIKAFPILEGGRRGEGFTEMVSCGTGYWPNNRAP